MRESARTAAACNLHTLSPAGSVGIAAAHYIKRRAATAREWTFLLCGVCLEGGGGGGGSLSNSWGHPYGVRDAQNNFWNGDGRSSWYATDGVCVPRHCHGGQVCGV